MSDKEEADELREIIREAFDEDNVTDEELEAGAWMLSLSDSRLIAEIKEGFREFYEANAAFVDEVISVCKADQGMVGKGDVLQ